MILSLLPFYLVLHGLQLVRMCCALPFHFLQQGLQPMLVLRLPLFRVLLHGLQFMLMFRKWPLCFLLLRCLSS